MEDAISSHKYYVIYTIISKDGKDKLFPFPFDNYKESEIAFEKIKDDNKEYKHSVFQEADIKVIPFLYLEKTYLTTDKIEEGQSFLEDQYGSLKSSMIPIDYVSEIFYKEFQEGSELNKKVSFLINEASRGIKVC
jgi:hypothetical protein